MCGNPSVVSGTRTYRDVLTDGEDVLIAESADASPRRWSDGADLVTDPELRQRIGAAARRKARRAYALDAAAAVLAGFLPRSAPALPAGRAARACSWSTRSSRPRRWAAPPGSCATTSTTCSITPPTGSTSRSPRATTGRAARPQPHRRLPGASGSAHLDAAEVNMDWRPFNPAVGDLFGRFLDRFEPDLVHFHAVQRLTASSVEETRARGIPYLW